MAESDVEFQDQIIIKRRANTEMETPKGGVWKIAFADFMTAMMCFFLVMWLINAANEDTRQAVASYFNPVRLAELNRKGLANPHVAPEDQPKDGEQTRDAAKPGEAPPKEERGDVSRDALFKDPYKVLAEIAGEADPSGEGYSTGGSNGAGGSGTDATQEFRDPFDPFFAESANANSGPAVETATASEALRPTLAAPEPEKPAGSAGEQVGAQALTQTGGESPTAGPALSTSDSAPVAAAESGSLPMSSTEGGTNPPALVELPAPPPEEQKKSSDWKELAAELTNAVEESSGSRRAPGVAVEDTGDGVMISLTDDADFGMFDIGSAEPQAELVRIMERVAVILKEHGGLITIRGHTDGRPFRTAAYDNWRLSTDRAQMAYYMLVRGGLDEQRVEAIEGYADRKLKIPNDPDAAENRRIEILLREATL
jgi:chemotaxis protein MotB